MQSSVLALALRLCLVALAFLLSGPACAACTAPAKPEGTLEYFSANNTFKFCNGADWIGVAQCGTSLGGCTTAGRLEYDPGISNFKLCDGVNWVPVANTKTLGACATAGQMDYDTTQKTFKSCDGTNWQAWATVGGLVGHWKLDDGTGSTTAADSAGTNTGTLSQMDPNTDWVAGKIGTALDFDGVNDDVTIGDVFDWADGQSFSVAGWFNRQSFTTDDFIIAKTSGVGCGSTSQYGILIGSGDKVLFRIADSAGDAFCMDGSQTFAASGWNHFVVVFNAGSTANSAIYTNGVLDSGVIKTGTAESIDGMSNTKIFKIGEESDVDQNPYHGVLDDLRIYDRALERGGNERPLPWRRRVPVNPL